ncbi:hypothetical protein [Candidatus Magnetobacterium casense]|uniref:Ig-like domain-containing protein n=1 Tax=Candidatus Magnetobacterium casense TaxID=1455061 RepID=A0ABS6S4K1_9BACT|nr:hypothetical protein [Candidatus Magnetobacterium casensis]MBV6343784.1 hypothetical protein [Candidatus Magnetobacterium casensis]
MATTNSSKRRQSYEVRVAEFVANNGPEFTLEKITYSEDDMECEACGKSNIHTLYWVKSTSTGKVFVIGCECQLLVLPVAEAHLPASQVRNLDLTSLVKLAAKYGCELTYSSNPSDEEMAELASEVITARRRFANTAGWMSRRAKVITPAQLELPLEATA